MNIATARHTLTAAANPAELVRISEAAMICRVHRTTLNRRIERGELPAWGSPRRVRIADVLAPYTPPAVRVEA